MTDTPRKYERRCRKLEVRTDDGCPMWAVEIWVNCRCPDCDKDGHWMSFAILRDENLAKHLSELKEDSE